MKKHKCRFVAKGFKQVPGVYFKLKHALTVSGASPRMFVATSAMEDSKLRHLGVKLAFAQVTVDEEIQIELPEEYQYFLGAVGVLNKSSYGSVQASRCFNQKPPNNLKT